MKTSEIRLHRPDLCLIKVSDFDGFTASGIELRPSETLPEILGEVVLAPASSSLSPGDQIIFPRYAAEEEYQFDDGIFAFLNVDDVEAIMVWDA
jgi:co-chaperonin GroES (HSP10)